MAIEQSLTQEIGENKKPQLDYTSPQSSFTQGDSDSESTSVSSSMQGSIMSATSSLDRYSSNVKEETGDKKLPNKSISRKLASSGSFKASRRRTQSKLSRSSVKLSDDGSTTSPQSSSIEVSDESSNYVQKPMPKFTRISSLRSVKIFRTNSKNKNKNKSNIKLKKSSINNFSQVSDESHLKKATFSSILKDSKFPEQLTHQSRPSEPEEVLPVAKICPYQHCSLHGHHHNHHEPPQKRFPYLKKRSTNNQKIVKPESQPKYKSSGKKREVKGTKMGSKDDDFSIEFYAKTRSEPEPFSSHDHGDAADMLFGVDRFQEIKNDINDIPMSKNRDFNDVIDEEDENLTGSKRVLEKEQSLEKTNHISMWKMIHQHMVSGLAAESGDLIVQQEDEEQKSETKEIDDVANQETEIRKMFAIKLVRDAIEKILLPEVQDDQSSTSEVISEQDSSEKSEITSNRKEESPAPTQGKKPGKGSPDRWSYLKKVILLTKFVRELEKVKKFNPKKARILPLPAEPESETVSLRRQTAGEKKNSDEWMLDYALQKVVSELAPTQKRKVALLVKAFETVAPAEVDPSESSSNVVIQRVGSKSDLERENKQTNISSVILVGSHKGEQGANLTSIPRDSYLERENKQTNVSSTILVGSQKGELGARLTSIPRDSYLERENKQTNVSSTSTILVGSQKGELGANLTFIPGDSYIEREKHIKMWHMIYQHVVTDIATKVGSDLLLDGEESTTSEEQSLQEVEDQTERNYTLHFTQSDAVKLVRESVDEILLPDIPDNSSQDTQSVASGIASDHDETSEKKDGSGSFTKLQQQTSKNWGKLKKLIMLKRSIKALEGFRKLKPQTQVQEILKNDREEEERVDLRRQVMDERKKAEQWMLDYAVQHIVTKLTPARKKRVSMLVEAFEAVVPFPDI